MGTETVAGYPHSDPVSARKRFHSANRWPHGYVSVAGFCRRVGISRSTAYNLVKSGNLPEPQRVTPVRKGWPADVINAWIAARPDVQYPNKQLVE